MTSAAVLFYGRRSRSSSRTFEDLTFASNPSPFPSSSSSSSSHPNTDGTINHRNYNRHRNPRGNLHRRHRHITFDDPDQLRHPSNNDLSHSPRFPLSGSETLGSGNPDYPAQGINSRETVHGVSGRNVRNNRLPGAVLLAKERLVQRLRGVSLNRGNRETSPSPINNNLWVVDADWETSVSRDERVPNALLNELPLGSFQESSSRELQTKPLGLTREAFLQLHHEVFMVHQTPVTRPMSNESNDCSICLESFVEGNSLINLPCGHRFHSLCLYPWLQSCGECPYCRSCIKFS